MGDIEKPEAETVLNVDDERLSKLITPPLDMPVYEPAENGPIDSLRSKAGSIIRTEHEGDMFFEAAEHESIANGVFLKNIHGIPESAIDHDCWTVNAYVHGGTGSVAKKRDINLKFGRVIALAGDFYSSNKDKHRTPICGAFFTNEPTGNPDEDLRNQSERFRSAVKSIVQDDDGNLIQLCSLIDHEHEKIAEHEGEYHTIANIYHEADKCGLPSSSQFWSATVGRSNPKLSLYTWLLFINSDHFGNDAVTAYTVGHKVALQLAREAGQLEESNEKERADGLQAAYLHEAFCLHYLTDLFSSGHIRTPRRELHNDSYTEASFSAARLVFGGKEVPIWDFQCNYMHDNDSATGLLVQNKKGEQWIAYGDKQFVENWDAVNHARVTHAVQVSVDEVYEAFKTTTEKHPSSFEVLDLIPQPMLSAEKGRSASWVDQFGGYDMHNPAALWKVTNEGDKSHLTIRANLNDYSLYRRVDGSPRSTSSLRINPTATPECVAIQQAPFRGSDAFPSAGPIDNLVSGGFLQIQDLNPPSMGVRTCVNFWGPAKVNLTARDNSKFQSNTFTLRNRLIDFDREQSADDAVTWHWQKWYDQQNGLLLFRFNRRSDGQVVVSQWETKDPCPTLPVTFDPNRSWAFSSTQTIHEQPLISLDNRQVGLTRFVVGNLVKRPSSSHPDIVCLSFTPDGPVQLALSSAGPGEEPVMILTLETRGIYQFVKCVKRQSGPDRILLARYRRVENDCVQVTFTTIAFSDTKEHHEETSKFNIPVSGFEAETSIVVGDLLGTGNDQAIVVHDTKAVCKYIIYAFNEGKLAQAEEFDILREEKSPVLRPFVTALLPAQPAQKKPPSILQLALHKVDEKPTLVFRVTNRASGSTEWKTTISRVEDPLSTDEHYFHLKWIRCTHQPPGFESRNALLEIFSFYGALGIRLFSAENSRKLDEYSEQGRQQYMGQTSLGTGLGAEGDWANGIMTWGSSENDFMDVTRWTPDVNGKMGEGAWGMREGDAGRVLIRGWQVEKRPGY
ncbi:hypothetical protein PEBR_38554 [Penicillium brasilianum]|uniref:Uncharacterized protein n=1 Tax=Penicillium brasilianum TaxID=104259 RepID=A0A1S9RC25_PENBI|nr:hypothetical protein PEBR_38554 [Penicillium brasilianum]